MCIGHATSGADGCHHPCVMAVGCRPSAAVGTPRSAAADGATSCGAPGGVLHTLRVPLSLSANPRAAPTPLKGARTRPGGCSCGPFRQLALQLQAAHCDPLARHPIPPGGETTPTVVDTPEAQASPACAAPRPRPLSVCCCPASSCEWPAPIGRRDRHPPPPLTLTPTPPPHPPCSGALEHHARAGRSPGVDLRPGFLC